MRPSSAANFHSASLTSTTCRRFLYGFMGQAISYSMAHTRAHYSYTNSQSWAGARGVAGWRGAEGYIYTSAGPHASDGSDVCGTLGGCRRRHRSYRDDRLKRTLRRTNYGRSRFSLLSWGAIP